MTIWYDFGECEASSQMTLKEIIEFGDKVSAELDLLADEDRDDAITLRREMGRAL